MTYFRGPVHTYPDSYPQIFACGSRFVRTYAAKMHTVTAKKTVSRVETLENVTD